MVRVRRVAATLAVLGIAIVGPNRGGIAHASESDDHSHRAPAATDCVDEALAAHYEAWLCIGNQLSLPGQGERWVIRLPLPRATDEGGVRGRGDSYDTWCETGSICRRELTPYIHETKGNAAYGDEDGVIGTFDQILKVNLNGRSPRLQGIWDWDSGPSVEFTGMRITCREEQFGPNPNCGSHAPDHNRNGAFTISSSDRRDTGRVINNEPVEDDGDYYAEITGYFTPNSYPRYVLGGLKSRLWECRRSWSPDCRFP